MLNRQNSAPVAPMRITTPGDSLGRRISRFLSTVLILVLIVLIAGVFVARSDGGKGMAEDRLSKWLGEEITIDKMYIGWPYALVMEKVASRGMVEAGGAGCKALEVKLSVGPFAGCCVRVNRGVINLAQRADGAWAPERFAKLGVLKDQNVAVISRMTESFRSQVTLALSDGTVRWTGTNGVSCAWAEGVALDMAPAHVPGRDMTHYRLSVFRSMGPDGKVADDEEREWLASETDGYIEISSSSRTPAAERPAFWETTR